MKRSISVGVAAGMICTQADVPSRTASLVRLLMGTLPSVGVMCNRKMSRYAELVRGLTLRCSIHVFV